MNIEMNFHNVYLFHNIVYNHFSLLRGLSLKCCEMSRLSGLNYYLRFASI
jgi:hypothetical protein